VITSPRSGSELVGPPVRIEAPDEQIDETFATAPRMPEPDGEADPVPIERFYDLTLVSDLSLSPDGERVAFVVEESERGADERRRSVCVVPTDGSRSPRRLARVSDAHSPQWGPDGTRLGVLAARERDSELAVTDADGDDSDGDGESSSGDGDGEGDDEPSPQVWVFDLEVGGDARQVTDRGEGVNEFDWGPEGERIVVAARDPTEAERERLEARREGEAPIETERLQHKFDGAGWLDTVTTYLFVVTIEDRAERRLEAAYGGGAYESITGLEPTWVDETGIAFLSNRLENSDDSAVMDLYLADAESGDVERITDGDLTVGTLEATPPGSETRLAFAADDPENWCIPTQVYSWDGEAYESLTAGLDRTLTRNASLCWIDDESLLTTIADEAHTRPCRVGTDGSVERVGTGVSEAASIPAFDARGGTVALALSHPTEGLDAHTAALDTLDSGGDGEASSGEEDGSELRRVTALNDDLLDDEVMPACHRLSYESSGHEIDAIAYLSPRVRSERPRPTSARGVDPRRADLV